MKETLKSFVIGSIIIFVLIGVIGGVSYTSRPQFTMVVKSASKSVVHINCPRWQGSGFIISEHLIQTARHVIEGVEDFEITLSDGTVVHAARAISDKEHDVGWIWVENPLPKKLIAELDSIEECVLGQDIFAVGSPYGKANFNSVTKGIISGLDRKFDSADRYGNKYGWLLMRSIFFQDF